MYERDASRTVLVNSDQWVVFVCSEHVHGDVFRLP